MTEKNILKPIVLLILDGWGYAPAWGGNAISVAKTLNFDRLWKEYPHTTLCASGECVGLPGHERGNSEVGHLNLGTGRAVKQDSSRISEAIKDGSFFGNTVLIEAIDHAQKRNGNLHLMGLVSDGGIHSHLDHLYALLELCQQQKFDRVYIHAFTDGRDTDPMAALTIVSHLQEKMKQLKIGQIATISGRYYGMDRDNHWERTAKVYNAMVKGEGITRSSVLQAISQSYNQGITDEFIPPTVITRNNRPITTVENGDSMIFFNFRSDRARQISMAFMAEKMPYFERGYKISHFYFVGMIPYGYEEELKLKLKSAFAPEKISNSLAEILANNNLKQYHSAETEKYAHVTYFFNGGREDPFSGEDRLLIPSPRVSSYDQKPEMSIREVNKKAIQAIQSGKYNFMVINFANPDMVGHTGNFKAVIKTCEIVDEELGRIVKTVLEKKALIMVTADHGNAEQMINPKTGQPHTEHTKNPVPFILIADQNSVIKDLRLRNGGVLADIMPSILEFLNLKPVPEMTGKTLITKI